MAQPKTPPLSIRVAPELLAAIDAMAERRQISRHAAVLRALVLGEAADRGITPASIAEMAKAVASFPPAVAPSTGVEMMARRRDKPKPHVNRLKTVWKAP